MVLLEGIRVLEYASFVAAPYCGKLLADLGAEVIKVESPDQGDVARRHGPFIGAMPDSQSSLLFEYLNVNKRGITLDLANHSGRDIFNKLVAVSDVLIEDSAPQFLPSVGLGYSALEQINPSIVVMSVTPFGQYGPRSHWKAHNLNTSHISGAAWLMPSGLARSMFPDREPIKVGGNSGDYFCGITAAVAVMFGLLGRQLSGQGQHIDQSKQESHMTLERTALSLWANQSFVETADSRDNMYGGCIPCKDGYVEVVTQQEQHWMALVKLMGDPEWARKSEFRDHESRQKHGEELNRYIMDWAKQYDKEYIYTKGVEHGVPIGVFHSPLDVVDSDHEKQRGFFAPVVYPKNKSLNRIPSLPFKFTGHDYYVRNTAPSLGEHNEPIYCGLLGYSRDQLVRLRRAEAI